MQYYIDSKQLATEEDYFNCFYNSRYKEDLRRHVLLYSLTRDLECVATLYAIVPEI